MYYNIKIKCDGCEFSLDSYCKQIVESEMDKYFATMFGASEEFKSQIKNIEIVDCNVKSIEDFKNLDVGAKLQDEDSHEDVKPDECQSEAPLLINENEVDSDTEMEVSPSCVETCIETPSCIDDYVLMSDTPVAADEEVEVKIPSIEPENYDSSFICSDLVVSTYSKDSQETFEKIDLESSETINKQDSDVLNDPIEHINDDIENLISAVEKEIKAVNITDDENYDSILTKDTKENKKDDLFVEEELVFEEGGKIEVEPIKKDEIASQAKSDEHEKKDNDIQQITPIGTDLPIELEQIDNNENNDLSKDDKEEPKFFEEPQTISEDVEISTSEEILTEVKNEQIETLKEIEFKNDDNKAIENINQEKLNDIFSQDINKNKEPEKDLITNLLEEINNPIPSYEEYLEQLNRKLNDYHNQVNAEINMPISKKESIQDFKMYLAGFKCSELIDEFLICSYYIKNILNENCFSMKSINSNLYKATGMIADMSVVNELIELGYIKTVYVEDMKKYTITQDGEAYFASRFKS